MTAHDLEALALRDQILAAAATPNAVIWPHSKCKAVKVYARGRDGRVHWTAPVDEAFSLHGEGLIDKHGVITEKGRALSQSKGLSNG